jgi:hypothetical protein
MARRQVEQRIGRHRRMHGGDGYRPSSVHNAETAAAEVSVETGGSGPKE